MKIFTKQLLILFALAISSSVYAQPELEYIWGGPLSTGSEYKNSTFEGGLNDWTTSGLACADTSKTENALWNWTPDGELNGAYFDSTGILNAPSINNGAVGFDSDFLDNGGEMGQFGKGVAPAPQTSILTSPLLDFSGEDGVAICFYESFKNFTAITTIEASGDGGATWTAFPIIVNNYVPLNEGSSSLFVNVDISKTVANKSNVYVRFKFDGGSQGYYYWMIDDVAFIKPLARDIDIVDISVPTITEMQPVFFVAQCDEMTFSFRVVSTNDNTITNEEFSFKVEVISPTGEVLYSDITTADSIVFSEQEVFFPNTWMPVDEVGEYTIKYSLVGSNDEIVYNNTLEGHYYISGNVFDSSVGLDISYPYTAIPPENIYAQFTFLDICGNATMNGLSLAIDSVIFSASSVGLSSSIVGRSVGVYIERIVMGMNPDPPTGTWSIANWEEVGYRNFEYTSDSQNAKSVSVTRFVDSLGLEKSYVEVKRDEVYAICLVSQKDLAYGVGPYNYGASRSALVVDEGVYTGFGVNYSVVLGADRILPPDIRTTLKIILGSKELLADDVLQIIQNPLVDDLRLKFKFENPKNISYAIASMSGSIIRMGNWESLQNDTKSINVSSLQNGSYLLRVETENGMMTKKFIIVK